LQHSNRLSRRFTQSLFFIAIVNLLLFSVLSVQSSSRGRAKVRTLTNKKLDQEFLGGVIDRSDLKIGFLNNGRFCPPLEFLPDLPNARYGDYGYLSALDLWVGIPRGPWSPEVWDPDSLKYIPAGATVSGTVFEPRIAGTDWSTINATKGSLYSGELLYSQVYKPSSLFDFMLTPISDYPQTWPRAPFTGLRQWPGRWKKDPERGKPMTGVFLGDQDLFLSFDDRTLADEKHPQTTFIWESSYWDPLRGRKFPPQQGYPIGAEVMAQVVGFKEPPTSNIIIFDLRIINTSEWEYHDTYLGIFYQAEHPLYDFKNERIISDRWGWEHLSFIKNEYDEAQGTAIPYNLSISSAYGSRHAIPDSILLGVQFLKTPIASPDGIDNDGDGQVDEAEGEELGLTGWHYITDATIMAAGKREQFQYQILAGDTAGFGKLVNKYCFYSSPGESFQFDTPEKIRVLSHVSVVMSCGPIHWAPGDTLNFVFAIQVASSGEKLKGSARLARNIVTNDYLRSTAPPPPGVTAVPSDGKVTLYWDRSVETAKNSITGYQDFEGYKIYRTTSDPANNDWGQPIYDHDGNLINFLPIARCDLDNGIRGYEKIYPFQKLGDDTGLFHSWTDTTVTNGKTYWYSVCSYNRGIVADEKLNPAHFPIAPLAECARGTDPASVPNLVKVVPGRPASNYSPAGVTVERTIDAAGNGPIEARIIDPFRVTGHDYLVTFEDTSFGYAVYDLYDATENRTIFEKVQQTNGEEGIIFDGIQLSVQRYDDMEILNRDTYWYRYETGERSDCTWMISGGRLTLSPHPFEYEIRFIDSTTTGVFTGKTAPFEIRNTVLDKKCVWDIYFDAQTDTTDSLKNTWSNGDIIYVWDDFGENNPYTLRIIITEYSYFSYQGHVNIPPQPGDAAHIALKRPFRTGDQFRITTTAMQTEKTDRSELDRIKVVPNPYIVEAGWELSRNESKIQFVNLPSECKIHIFSMAGDKVKTLYHNDPTKDYEFWDLLNNSNLKVSYGLYIFVVETADGKSTRGKFVILR